MSTFDADPHLPTVHLRPPRNWLNDPNGLVHHNGHYHVFFQYNPHGPDHANMHWGHFRSPDLVRWELMPVALAPTPGGEDADGCYSGNAVSDGDRLIAFYSAYRTDRWWQPVTTATSTDAGTNFVKRPLAMPQPPAGTTMFRDPYVWRQDHRWRMLVGASMVDGSAAALLYESPDLKAWSYQGQFAAGDPGTGTGWECPQYATFGERGALIVSHWHPQHGPQRVLAYTGREHGGRFVTGDPVPLDHGPDFYAPALLPAPDGRWLLWGWAPEARSPDWVGDAGWAGVLTLPRELSLTEDGTLRQQPARELFGLRTRRILHHTGQVARQPVEIGQLGGSFDLTASLRRDRRHCAGLRLITSADAGEYLDISHDPTTGQIVVDRDHASHDPRARGGIYTMPYPYAGTPEATTELRIIADRSIIEFFTPHGQVLTLRTYPTGSVPWILQAHAGHTGTAQFAVDAWQIGHDTTHVERRPAKSVRRNEHGKIHE
ncbi:MAG TPA: glycoside hydrolase family 32 protein [Rugosimonospora sp.]|nr:glycoside hydrolase family 32 protein [Rugosimonospora sp.]